MPRLHEILRAATALVVLAVLAGCAKQAETPPAAVTPQATSTTAIRAYIFDLACAEVKARFEVHDTLVTLTYGTEKFELARARAASGVRYESASDPTTWLWNQGDSTTVSVRGKTTTCFTTPVFGRPYRAHGNEPFWSVEIAGTRVTWRTPEDSLAGTVGAPEPIANGRRWSGEVGGRPIVVTATAGVCHDGMSGMAYPATVAVTLGDRTYGGCGGEPAALLQGTPWNVVEIAGRPVLADSRVTLAFGGDGRVGGSASCNSYGASYTLSGEGMTFGQAVSTMKACDEPLMQQEAAFLGVLREVRRFDVEANGALVLSTDDGRAIRATR